MLRVGRGYLQIQAPHEEAHESTTEKAHVHLLLAETQTDQWLRSEDVTSFFGKGIFLK